MFHKITHFKNRNGKKCEIKSYRSAQTRRTLCIIKCVPYTRSACIRIYVTRRHERRHRRSTLVSGQLLREFYRAANGLLKFVENHRKKKHTIYPDSGRAFIMHARTRRYDCWSEYSTNFNGNDYSTCNYIIYMYRYERVEMTSANNCTYYMYYTSTAHYNILSVYFMCGELIYTYLRMYIMYHKQVIVICGHRTRELFHCCYCY